MLLTSSYDAASVALLGPLVFIGYITLKCLYNVLFHPLRSYPGPLLARASIIPYQRQALNGYSHLWIQDLHRKYGSVVRIAPNELSFIDPVVWKDVYGHRATAFLKQPEFYGPDTHGNPPGIIRADNVAHARQRKTVSHAFSDKALRDQEDLLKGHVGLLLEKLKGMAEGNLQPDIVEWYNFTTFDIMGDLTFGEPLHQLTESTYHPWVKTTFSFVKVGAIFRVCRAWPGLTGLLQSMVSKENREKRKQYIAFASNSIDKRMARKTERPDIWTYVTRQGQEAGGMHPSELYSNGTLFMLAGTETTATELSGLTYLLLKNPDKMRRLTEELRATFTSFDDMSMSKLSQVEYLGACIEEGLRYYPPVALGLARTTPQGGASICGKYVPAGTIVHASQFSAHHSPTNFANPERFVPERFLPEGQKEYGLDRRDALNPFSTGPRNCIGKNLAYHEMRLMLASVLFHFDLELCDTESDWLHQKTYTLWEKPPLFVRLKLRK